MQTWIFKVFRMLKNCIAISALALMLSACSWMVTGRGQVIFHWEREHTGVEKFARDHSECLRKAEYFTLIPDVKSWFYSEEVKLDIRADWHSDKGIWASYIPYPGAQPIVVNSLRDDSAIDPNDYRNCMEKRGYWNRKYNIPSTTNIFIYKPQRIRQNTPFMREW